MQTFSSLSSARFRWYWVSTLFTYAAAQMDTMIKGWLIFRMTGSAADLGLVTMAAGVPLILVSLFGGVVADRVDRLKSLVVTQFLALFIAITTATLLATQLIQFWHFIALAILQGLTFAFIAPLRQSIIARLVPPAELTSAVALSSASLNIMGILGPVSVGLMLTFLQPEQVYIIIIACYICGAAMLMLIKLQHDYSPAARPFHLDMAEGFRFIGAEGSVLGLLLVALVSSFFCIPYIYMLPALASKVLKVDQVGFGFLCAAAGAGSLIGSLAAGSLSGVKRKGSLVLVLMVIFGAFIALSAQFQLYWVALLSIMFAALAGTAYMTLCNTMVLKDTPANLHGRVISIFTMAIGFTPLGGLPMGAMADQIGLPDTFMASGSIAVLFAIIMWLFVPALKKAQ